MKPSCKMKGHFLSAVLQCRGWVRRGDAGSLPHWEPAHPHTPCPIGVPYKKPQQYSFCNGCNTHPHTRSQSCLLLQWWLQVLLEQSLSALQGAAGSPAWLLAPKRLHLRSGLCGYISALGDDAFKGRPAPKALPRASFGSGAGLEPLFCNLCGIPRGFNPILVLVFLLWSWDTSLQYSHKYSTQN